MTGDHMTTNGSDYDVVVVGGGAVGLAAAWNAARRGRSVLVLEQYELFTQRGSSGGAERQWRLQYSEEDLARLTLEAQPLWRELEEAGGRRLVHHTGSLWFGDTTEATNEGMISDAAKVLERIGVTHEWLTAREIQDRFPFAALPDHYEGFYQPDGGIADVKGTLWLLHEQARLAGVTVLEHAKVEEIAPDADGVTVRSGRGVHRGQHVIIAAGPFAKPLLAPLGIELDVHLFQMTSASFRLRDPGLDLPTWFAFQKPTEEDTNLFYGFGRNPWSGSDVVRAGPDFEDHVVEDPYLADNAAVPRHLERLTEWVGAHMPALDPEPELAGSFLAALPADPERQFYLGHAPAHVPNAERLVIFSTGWGFKFVPLLGRACAELALDGRTGFDLGRFGLV